MRRMTETVYQSDSIAQRMGKFLALLVIVFAIVTAVVVTQRLSDDSLALIIGLLLAGIPLLALIIVLIFILFRISQRAPQPAQGAQQMMLPPIILQMPPSQRQQPALSDYGDGDTFTAPPKKRRWNVIGNE